MKLKLVFLITVLVLFFSCTDDKESDLIEEIITETVTYTDNVKTIIDNNCIVCHNSGANPIAPFPLETYTQVKEKAENSGPLLFRIQLDAGNPQIMPQTGKMPQNLIDVIVSWAEEGFLE
jgi:uncharacterized membrane protein